MKHLYLITIFTFILSLSFLNTNGQSQRWKYMRHEALFGIGASNFMGELGGKNGIGTNNLRDFDFPSIRPVFHFGHSYRIAFLFNIVNDISFGYLYGNDQFTNETFRNNRNIHFRSPLFEYSSLIHFYPFPEKEGAKFTLSGYRLRLKKKSILQWFSSGKVNVYPFFYTGISFFHFNPQAKYPIDGEITSMQGKWISLKPLKTEGQGLFPTRPDYSLNQIAIPFGMGVKYFIDMYWAVTFEYGFRITFIDYIDDVSTTYVDPAILKNAIGGEQGDLAAHFSNPNNKNLGSSITMAGQQRGDIRDRDTYMFAKISMYYKIIPKEKIAIPKFK